MSVESPRGALSRLGTQAGVLAVRGYQLTIRPMLGPACRYEPSCSQFTLEAIQRHGLLRGSWLGARRLSRCHPLGGHGYDPVP